MEHFKDWADRLKKTVAGHIDAGNVMQANEIAANILVGTVTVYILLIMVACLVLNEFGVFTANPTSMRIAVALAAIIDIPIAAYNSRMAGEGKATRYVLEYGLLASVTILAAFLGHNVTLVMIIPSLLSTRYYDVKFTRIINMATIVLFAGATVLSALYGILNLNYYHVPAGTELSVADSLRNAVIESGIDYPEYVKSLMLNDFLPRVAVFSLLGYICSNVAMRGKNLIDTQEMVSKKSGRIETELNLATEIQKDMLPCIFPAFPGHRQLELYALNRPAKEVGGDFYDYFIVDDKNVAIVMADVSGKGVGAALFMMISKTLIKNQILSGRSIAEAMNEANRQLCENNKAGLFVTTWAGIYNTETHILTFVNAGHNPPLVYRKGEKFEYLRARSGIVLAGLERTNYRENSIELNPGDGIFLYTDGVTEATDRNKELYGDDRLLNFLNSAEYGSVEEKINEVLADIDSFVGDEEQFDDITMLGMRVNENS